MHMQALMLRIVAYGGGAYLLLNLYAWLVSDWLLFAPQEPSYSNLPNEVRIPVGNDRRINAVFLEHPAARWTILFSHGEGVRKRSFVCISHRERVGVGGRRATRPAGRIPTASGATH